MFRDCSILPSLIDFEGWDKYKSFEEKIYQIFINDIYNQRIYYRDKIVSFRKYPLYDDKQESFYHIICKKIKKNNIITYQPTPERAQRIKWCKSIILNEPCINACCDGIGVWEEDVIDGKKSKIQTILYLKKFKYIIVLEERPQFWLFITSYYVDDEKKRKQLDKQFIRHKRTCV